MIPKWVEAINAVELDYFFWLPMLFIERRIVVAFRYLSGKLAAFSFFVSHLHDDFHHIPEVLDDNIFP